MDVFVKYIFVRDVYMYCLTFSIKLGMYVLHNYLLHIWRINKYLHCLYFGVRCRVGNANTAVSRTEPVGLAAS